MNANSTWIQCEPLRGCALCRHGDDDENGVRICTSSDAVGRKPEPVAHVRSLGGNCGPDARFLEFKSLTRS